MVSFNLNGARSLANNQVTGDFATDMDSMFENVAYLTPDAGGDDTANIDAAYEAVGGEGTLVLSEGEYNYDGDGLDGTFFNIVGGRRNKTVINVGTGKWFIRPTAAIVGGSISNLKFMGGAGAFKHDFTGSSSPSRFLIFRDCLFEDYETCAIGSLSSDFANLRVYDSHFSGTNEQSIAFAVAGLNGGCGLFGCTIQNNLYDIKLANAGKNVEIVGCSFQRAAQVATARHNIWLIPDTAGNGSGSGNGFKCLENKFGNENQNTGDLKILIADEGTTVTDFLDTPHTTTPNQTGPVRGLLIAYNSFENNANQQAPVIYSYASEVRSCVIGPNHFTGNVPSEVITFDEPLESVSPNMFIFGNAHHSSGIFPYSNRADVDGIDPGEIWAKNTDGTPTDGDFANPRDGMLALDGTNDLPYMRIGGAWVQLAVST